MCKSPLLSLCCLQFRIRSWVHRGPNFRPHPQPFTPASWRGGGDCKMFTYQMGDVIPPAHPGSNPDFLNWMGLTSPGRHPKGILTRHLTHDLQFYSDLLSDISACNSFSSPETNLDIFVFQNERERLIHKLREFPASFPLFGDWCRITRMLYHTLVR